MVQDRQIRVVWIQGSPVRGAAIESPALILEVMPTQPPAHEPLPRRHASPTPSASLKLLEREGAIDVLNGALAAVRKHGGRTVLLRGEAGIGKSSVVRAWAMQADTQLVAVHWGACEALDTPRPLGPIIDLAAHMDGAMRDAVRDHQAPGGVFKAFSEWLGAVPVPHGARAVESRVNVVVIEDVHWADHPTLDLLKYLGRRMHHWQAMLVLTYRDEDVGALHPLTQVLGELPSAGVSVIALQPLSPTALHSLSGYDPARLLDLHRATGGNPFFVTEILAAHGSLAPPSGAASADNATGVPITVAAAVMARVQRTSADAREVLVCVSLAPGSCELALVQALLPESADRGVDECVQCGLLQWRERGLSFRHELARLAIENSLPPNERQSCHARVLSALQQLMPQSLDRLAYHAARAHDAAAVLDIAPRAAARAARLGAHREASAHLRAALDAMTPDTLPGDAQRAHLLESWAHECFVLGRNDPAALTAIDHAVALRRRLADPLMLGKALREQFHGQRLAGDPIAAKAALDEAITTLESVAPSPELAMAYSTRSALHMLQNEWRLTELWGDRAIALAQRFDAPQTLAHALNNIGSVLVDDGQPRGYAMLEQSLAIALEHGFHNDAARAYVNASETATRNRDLVRAQPLLTAGIHFVQQHDLDRHAATLLSVQSNVRLMHGLLDDAVATAHRALAITALAPSLRNGPHTVCGTVELQRNLPEGRAMLQRVWLQVLPARQPDFIARVAMGLAEGAWLAGDFAACAAVVEQAIDACHDMTEWDYGELACWYQRAGRDSRAFGPRKIAPPCLAEIDGNWPAAANHWHTLRMPRHQAYVLMRMDTHLHPNAIGQAIDMLVAMGATVAADVARKRARHHAHAGIKGIKTGPRAAARANPFGLTPRESQILPLVAQGLSNLQIAQTLSRSERTVEHHVTSLLGKLRVKQRGDVAAMASIGAPSGAFDLEGEPGLS